MTLNDFDPVACRYDYLVTDSRSVFNPSKTIFAAIRTDLGDGHNYISDLYRKGVRAFIVDNLLENAPADATFIVTPNVPKYLSDIARTRTSSLSKGIIVTGSVGKTTMKELLYQSLIGECDVRRSPRSWNSSIGVPLAIWDMTRKPGDNPFLITEAGIDGPGQGQFLSEILAGSHSTAVITPITDEHDEAFKCHADKIKEKIDLISHCSTIIYADTDAKLRTQLEMRMPNANLIAVKQDGHTSIYHALAAKVIEHIGIPSQALKKLDTLPLVNKRREISAGSFGNTIYRDYFTADLRSLQDALDFMLRHTSPLHSTALFLGDLIDGGQAEAVKLAQAFGIDRIEPMSEDLLTRIHAGNEFRDMQILLFGKDNECFSKVAEALESAGHDTTLEVDLDAMAHNYNHYRSLVPPGTGIVAMVKASAYGVGAVETGKNLQSLGASYLAVAVIEEGITLREAGITMPIMVLNPVTNRYPALFAHHLEPAVFSYEELDRLISEAEAAGVSDYPVHIKLDTGMHRVGFLDNHLEEIARRLNATKAVRTASVFSHLATADCLDMDAYTKQQLSTFYHMTNRLEGLLGNTFKRHILNTAGMMRFAGCGKYELARLGIGLYGISPYPGPEGEALRPVAAFRSHIISLKHWPKGTPIGYGCRSITPEDDAVIATVPVGYADGVNRHFGRGNASFVVRGIECPTIGNICMDLCMVDVSGVPDVSVGDSVEIFGPEMPVERLASILDTIPYEILTSVSQRVKRVYVKR